MVRLSSGDGFTSTSSSSSTPTQHNQQKLVSSHRKSIITPKQSTSTPTLKRKQLDIQSAFGSQPNSASTSRSQSTRLPSSIGASRWRSVEQAEMDKAAKEKFRSNANTPTNGKAKARNQLQLVESNHVDVNLSPPPKSLAATRKVGLKKSLSFVSTDLEGAENYVVSDSDDDDFRPSMLVPHRPLIPRPSRCDDLPIPTRKLRPSLAGSDSIATLQDDSHSNLFSKQPSFVDESQDHHQEPTQHAQPSPINPNEHSLDEEAREADEERGGEEEEDESPPEPDTYDPTPTPPVHHLQPAETQLCRHPSQSQAHPFSFDAYETLPWDSQLDDNPFVTHRPSNAPPPPRQSSPMSLPHSPMKQRDDGLLVPDSDEAEEEEFDYDPRADDSGFAEFVDFDGNGEGGVGEERAKSCDQAQARESQWGSDYEQADDGLLVPESSPPPHPHQSSPARSGSSKRMQRGHDSEEEGDMAPPPFPKRHRANSDPISPPRILVDETQTQLRRGQSSAFDADGNQAALMGETCVDGTQYFQGQYAQDEDEEPLSSPLSSLPESQAVSKEDAHGHNPTSTVDDLFFLQSQTPPRTTNRDRLSTGTSAPISAPVAASHDCEIQRTESLPSPSKLFATATAAAASTIKSNSPSYPTSRSGSTSKRRKLPVADFDSSIRSAWEGQQLSPPSSPASTSTPGRVTRSSAAKARGGKQTELGSFYPITVTNKKEDKRIEVMVKAMKNDQKEKLGKGKAKATAAAIPPLPAETGRSSDAMIQDDEEDIEDGMEVGEESPDFVASSQYGERMEDLLSTSMSWGMKVNWKQLQADEKKKDETKETAFVPSSQPISDGFGTPLELDSSPE